MGTLFYRSFPFSCVRYLQNKDFSCRAQCRDSSTDSHDTACRLRDWVRRQTESLPTALLLRSRLDTCVVLRAAAQNRRHCMALHHFGLIVTADIRDNVDGYTASEPSKYIVLAIASFFCFFSLSSVLFAMMLARFVCDGRSDLFS